MLASQLSIWLLVWPSVQQLLLSAFGILKKHEKFNLEWHPTNWHGAHDQQVPCAVNHNDECAGVTNNCETGKVLRFLAENLEPQFADPTRKLFWWEILCNWLAWPMKNTTACLVCWLVVIQKHRADCCASFQGRKENQSEAKQHLWWGQLNGWVSWWCAVWGCNTRKTGGAQSPFSRSVEMLHWVGHTEKVNVVVHGACGRQMCHCHMQQFAHLLRMPLSSICWFWEALLQHMTWWRWRVVPWRRCHSAAH